MATTAPEQGELATEASSFVTAPGVGNQNREKSPIHSREANVAQPVKGQQVGTTIVISPTVDPEPLASKLVSNTPSIVLSLVAIGISVASFFYNKRRDERSRQQSIQDDFWVRKIISPISVEPFLKYSTQLTAGLPTAHGFTHDMVREFWTDNSAKITEYTLTFGVFGFLDRDLDAALQSELEKFDECLAVYCGKLMQHLTGGSMRAPNRDQSARTLMETTFQMLKLIRLSQVSMGAREAS